MSRQISDLSEATVAERQGWMATLARASLAELETAWSGLASPPGFTRLRPPETGLVMVRGRISGSGQPFNLGEMTMTRAAVRLESGPTGFGHVAGRSARHAELAAVFDALLQDPARRETLIRTLIRPLAARAEAEQRRKASEVAATKVDFFTLVRGEN